MPKICFYLHLHQPHRLRDISIFDVGKPGANYFYSDQKDDNREIFLKVAHKSYLPMLSLLNQLINEHEGFNCAFSISGVFLEQAEKYVPEVLELIQRLVKTGKVEILAETYYHSLASLYSPTEFLEEVKQHEAAIQHWFEVKPSSFRNTELIYSNHIAQMVAKMGYQGMLTEAVDRYMGGRQKTKLYSSYAENKLPLLLKHAPLSDDIAFRFSNRQWQWHPLSAERYLDWVELYPENDYVNLFMDFETFGEHQWEDTGIFEFFRVFVARFLQKEWNSFVTPEMVFSQLKPPDVAKLPVYDVPEPISWADIDRDTTAWTENELQQDTLRLIYSLEKKVKQTGNQELLNKWKNLLISDHFYYMCTKWSADGDVHAYFSPYETPYEAYRSYCIALADLQENLI